MFKENYSLLDIEKFFFACSIPLLHIPFSSDSVGIVFLQQYISRLGVPFFFCVAGFFLSQSIELRGAVPALKHYVVRVGRMLAVWLIIYSPFLLHRFNKMGMTAILELAFMTPAYLWYLVALLIAAIPFCLIKNRKLIVALAVIFYIVGTVMGDSYNWLYGGIAWYKQIFLTTRNGIFFAFPFLCAGEICRKMKKTSLRWLILAFAALFVEISFVRAHCALEADTSLYILMPAAIMLLVAQAVTIDWNIDKDFRILRGASGAIYVMQYGFIKMACLGLELCSLQLQSHGWLVYMLTISGSIIFYLVVRKSKMAKILF